LLDSRCGAANKLKERLKAIGNGNFLGPRIEKVTIDELYADLIQDYRINSQTVEWAERVWNVHLKDSFSGMRAANLGTNQITGYVEKRLNENAAKSTINRELALLRRAFSIGFDAEPQKVVRVPKFHKYIVSEKGNERQGFVEDLQYRKLAGAAAGRLWLRGLLALGYTYGFRRAELVGKFGKGQWKQEPMRCRQVDLLNRTVELYSGTTKNGERRKVALTDECLQLLTKLRRGKQPEDFLFTWQDGSPLKDFRDVWYAITEAAGVPGLLFHDLRRSAVRNMERRGVPRKTARQISGHKTDTVYERYNITNEQDIRDAARKIEEGSIHSSFIVAQNQGSEEIAPKDRKPS
jgi:integrase